MVSPAAERARHVFATKVEPYIGETLAWERANQLATGLEVFGEDILIESGVVGWEGVVRPILDKARAPRCGGVPGVELTDTDLDAAVNEVAGALLCTLIVRCPGGGVYSADDPRCLSCGGRGRIGSGIPVGPPDP